MPVLMLQERFADKVERGEKRRTIRPPHKIVWQLGMALSLRTWTGKPYGSKQRTLREAKLLSVEGVIIHDDGIEYSPGTMRAWWLGADSSKRPLLEHFAREDGFDSWEAMRAWFEDQHGLPFIGQLITWE